MLRGFDGRRGAGRARRRASPSASTRPGEVIVAARARRSSRRTSVAHGQAATARRRQVRRRGASSACWPTATTSATTALGEAGPASGRTRSRRPPPGIVWCCRGRVHEELAAVGRAARAGRLRTWPSAEPSRRTSTARPAIELAAGHEGEYDAAAARSSTTNSTPREYELSVAQTVLQVHTPGRRPLQPADEPDRAAAAADRRGAARAAGARAGQQPRVRAAAQRRLRPAHQHPLAGRRPRTTWTNC